MSKLREQIREARLIRVLLVYLGASWAILEATALMRDEAHLPSWVVPLAAILLVVGLVIITTTAWIQARPITRLRADELPSPWEVDLAGGSPGTGVGIRVEMIGTIAIGDIVYRK